MKKAIEMVKTFCAEEDGATAVEYGLMVALIAAVIVLAVTNLGTKVRKIFEDIVAAI